MIEVLNLQSRYWVNRKKFAGLLGRLVQRYALGDVGLTLAFVDTRKIVQLNRRFMKRNGPTDVLSFPSEKNFGGRKSYLGDIVISVPQAFKQSFAEAHGLETELLDLTVHGFLHLLDFDHGRGIEDEEIRVRKELVNGN